MNWSGQYQAGKARLLGGPSVCAENKALLTQFFAYEEYKLKRQNGLAELDAACYKTLYGYVTRFWNVLRWFDGKPWTELTREDIQRVYDDLEDGRLRNRRGMPYQDRTSYYNKIFKSKPFRLAGKDELARQVIEFAVPARRTVRFVTEPMFRRLAGVVSNPRHLLLLWLAWDLGENLSSLLCLTKRHFAEQRSSWNGESEYVVDLSAVSLKRSRQKRSEVTLYPETALYLGMVLEALGPGDRLFPFEHRAAAKFLAAAVRKSRATTLPNHEPVRWKDLRSGMACHLLRSGWSRDEVNARLGHTPSSGALNAYINFMAIDRSAAKQKLYRQPPSPPPSGPTRPLDRPDDQGMRRWSFSTGSF